jgi:hypothetical protein
VAGNTVRFRWRESPQLFDGWGRGTETVTAFVRAFGLLLPCLVAGTVALLRQREILWFSMVGETE